MFAALTFALLATTAQAADPYIEVDAGRISRGLVIADIDATVEDVVALVSDCDRAEDWFPDLMNTTTLDKHGTTVHCDGVTNLPWPIPDRTWEITTDVRVETIDGVQTWVLPFNYIEGSGNLDELRGQYRLTRTGPQGMQTHLEYEACIDLGFWVPEPLVAWGTRRVLPGIITGIEEQTSSSSVAVAMR